jgi:hypothetical protein
MAKGKCQKAKVKSRTSETPCDRGTRGRANLRLQPSPPWGRGWTATGAFTSRGGAGRAYARRRGTRWSVNEFGFSPQAGEGV